MSKAQRLIDEVVKGKDVVSVVNEGPKYGKFDNDDEIDDNKAFFAAAEKCYGKVIDLARQEAKDLNTKAQNKTGNVLWHLAKMLYDEFYV